MPGAGESSSAGRASAMRDSDAQLARKLQKLLDEEALEDGFGTHRTKDEPVLRTDDRHRPESHGSMKGKGKAKSDDYARGSERRSERRPAGEHESTSSASKKSGKFRIQCQD